MSTLPDALVKALSQVVADLKVEWEGALRKMAMESMEVITKLKSDLADANLKAVEQQQAIADLISSSLVIDRRGHLMIGSKDLGKVTGEDGAPGLGFDDMEEKLLDDGRTIVRSYTKGDINRHFYHRFEVPLYKGTWSKDHTYQGGDVVTHGGSMWIAKELNSTKPGESDYWVLAVKRGKDGKDLRDANS